MSKAARLDTSSGGHALQLNAAGQNRCPTCDQPITGNQFEAVRRRIEAADRKQAQELKEGLAQVRAEVEAWAAAQVALAGQTAATQIADATEAMAVKLEQAEQAKAAELEVARAEATEAATEAVAAKLSVAEEKAKTAAAELDALKEGHAEALVAARAEATATATEAVAAKLSVAEEKAKTAAAELDALKEGHAEALVAARAEATATATEAVAAKLSVAEEKAKTAAAELDALKEGHAEALVAARAEATATATEAVAAKLSVAEEKAKTAAAELDALKKSQDEMLNQRLTEQRGALEEDKDRAVNEANAEAFKEKQKVEAQVAKLTRQLQQKTSDELGEGAEIVLFEALKAAFPGDKITRIQKGEPGVDVLHEVMDDQTSCGLVVYDSKNRKAWRNEYVEKLRSDQIAARATHALLSTHVFPSGASQLLLRDGVIVVNPARAVAVATLLRQQMIQMHAQRLSDEQREEKMTLVYDYITSNQFAQLMKRIEDYADDLLELDVKEKKAHEQTWTKRGTLVKSLQRAQGQLASAIDRVVCADSSDVAAAG